MCRHKANLDPYEQAERHCTLPGFDRSTWTGGQLIQIHMGAPPRYDLEGEAVDLGPGGWQKPREDVSAGCPGAYYRTPWCRSLFTYYRQRDEHGGRVANPALDACSDPLVHEAIVELESYEETALGEYIARKFPPQE